MLRHLLYNTSVQPMAHLTCVGSSYAEAAGMIREFLDAGVTSFLALRGDPPAGVAEEDVHLGDLGSAAELVQLIHRVQKERVPFTLHDVPGFPGAKRIGDRERVTIAVAAFPNGHPRSRSQAQDIDTLLAKQAAGANLAISQLFFHADEYLTFVDAARTAGVTMRLLPGIMPVLSMPRLKRVLELTLEAPPRELIARLESAESPEAASAAGIEFTTSLARDLLDGGVLRAPPVHVQPLRSSARRPRRRRAPRHDKDHRMTTNSRVFPTGTILGYPRIGRRRELKRAIEAFWKHDIGLTELEGIAAGLRGSTRERLASLGLGTTDSSIPESFSYYDQVLDAAVTVGAIPERFADLVDDDGGIDLPAYFTIARGEGDKAPLEMTKWFDSNYHYLVPEIGPDTEFHLASERLVEQVAEAKAAGYTTRPVIVGPVTLLLLSKPADGVDAAFQPLSKLEQLLPVYSELLGRLAAAGAEWVQFDEPGLVSESIETPRGEVLTAVQTAYETLGSNRQLGILVAAPYGALDDALPVLEAAPIDAIAIDLVRGAVPTGAKTDKVIVGGVIDGHNIWRGDLEAAFGKLEALTSITSTVAVATSTNLFHTPHDVDDEPDLSDQLKSWLAFADQKVAQVEILARGLRDGKAAIQSELDAASAALDDRHAAAGVRDGDVRRRTAALEPTAFQRGDYETRRTAQDAAYGLPPLPTTTIGSFPQTGAIRTERARFAKGEIDQAEYEALPRAGDPRRRRAAGAHRARRARARRARAQRHGAVLRREPRRLRGDARTAGCSRTDRARPAPASCGATCRGPLPSPCAGRPSRRASPRSR